MRKARAKAAAARRTVAPIARNRTARRAGIVSLIAVGTLAALAAAVLVAAAVDPRADAMLRRGWRSARGAFDGAMDDLPDVSLGRLESLGGQITELGQRLSSAVRARF
ncbi:MAG TPA: hypothetical protein VGF56_12580 [Rhizomicrobium sp.]